MNSQKRARSYTACTGSIADDWFGGGLVTYSRKRYQFSTYRMLVQRIKAEFKFCKRDHLVDCQADSMNTNQAQSRRMPAHKLKRARSRWHPRAPSPPSHVQVSMSTPPDIMMDAKAIGTSTFLSETTRQPAFSCLLEHHWLSRCLRMSILETYTTKKQAD